jgi:hypothetical protein
MVKETRNIHRRVLPNGLTVITEQMSHLRSVSIGIWLKSGSRDETTEWNGISHFIEHMVFKGTENRSAEQIARSVDSIGGGLDAFTSKELVSYNVKVLDDHLPKAFDIVADLVRNPLFEKADFDYDGKWDMSAIYDPKTGVVAEVERDTDFDGKFDVKEIYDSAGQLTSVRRDRNGDGQPDLWEQYKDGVLLAILYDDDFDGKVDRREEIPGARPKIEMPTTMDPTATGTLDSPQAPAGSPAKPAAKPTAKPAAKPAPKK